MAQIRKSSRALRIHVGALGQEAALHGRRVRAMARTESRQQPRLAFARRVGSSWITNAGARSQSAISKRTRAVGSGYGAEGFQWIDANNGDENIIAFMRIAKSSNRRVICICNFSPVVRESYRIGVPAAEIYREILNTDSAVYGGSNQGNTGAVMAENSPRTGCRSRSR